MTCVLVISILMLGLAACGNKAVKDAAACSIEQNGITVRMSFDTKGDQIVKIKQTSTTNLVGYTEEQIASVQEEVSAIAAEYEGIDGVSYRNEQSDTEITEQIEINVTKEKTVTALIKAGLFPVDGDEVTYLSLEATLEALKEAGWTIEK